MRIDGRLFSRQMSATDVESVCLALGRPRKARCALVCLITGWLAFASLASAAVLPEDRADALFHYYDGGGVKVSGPAVLVRKGDNKSLSGFGHYYIDNVSSASIDVLATASPYREERTEYGVGLDYLTGDTIVSGGYSNSSENDYEADTFNLGVAHEMLNGMTTLSLGFVRGIDEVGKSTDENFKKDKDSWRYRLGVSQVLTKKWLLNLDYEIISEDGFLNNPYRSVRINGVFALPESYPSNRTSYALAVRALQYLPERSSLRYEYRYFSDNWDIQAHTFEVAFAQYYAPKIIGDYRVRYYSQTAASFYSDDFAEPQVFMARDKELATFNYYALGYKISWRIWDNPTSIFKSGSLNFSYNRFTFDYKDFTHYATGDPYSFRANVFQAFFSLYY